MILFKLIYSRYRKREAMAMEGGAGQEVMPPSCSCPLLYMQMGGKRAKRGLSMQPSVHMGATTSVRGCLYMLMEVGALLFPTPLV